MGRHKKLKERSTCTLEINDVIYENILGMDIMEIKDKVVRLVGIIVG